MNRFQAGVAAAVVFAACTAEASLLGITVSGQLSDPWTDQIFTSDTAVVGAGDEFTGSVSVGGSSVLQYYADIGESSVTIGIRHLGPFAIVFNANPFTWQIGGLDWAGSGTIAGFDLGDVFTQTLWPDAGDPNASWIGWGQDAEVAPPWSPQWDPVSRTLTIVATEGYTIVPYVDVFATFDVRVPVPTALPLMVSALALLAVAGRRRRGVVVTSG